MISNDDGYTHYLANRSRLRKWVRGFYLSSAAKLVQTPSVDFGCGIGELLARLGPGSVGLEINPATVAYCRELGLTVSLYDGDSDGWNLSPVPASRRFASLTLSHVLEHLENPQHSLVSLMRACRMLGIKQILVIVPGRKGFESDPTHVHFIDQCLLSAPALVTETGYQIDYTRYYPINQRWAGDYLAHNELRVRYILSKS